MPTRIVRISPAKQYRREQTAPLVPQFHGELDQKHLFLFQRTPGIRPSTGGVSSLQFERVFVLFNNRPTVATSLTGCVGRGLLCVCCTLQARYCHRVSISSCPFVSTEVFRFSPHSPGCSWPCGQTCICRSPERTEKWEFPCCNVGKKYLELLRIRRSQQGGVPFPRYGTRILIDSPG